jgi:hypothetical protein
MDTVISRPIIVIQALWTILEVLRHICRGSESPTE